MLALFAASRLRVLAAMFVLPFGQWVLARGSAFGTSLEVLGGSILLLRGADHDVSPLGARDGTAHEDDVVVGTALDDLEVLHGDAVIACCRASSAPSDAARSRAAADRPRPSVHHVAVGLRLAAEIVTSHRALEALALARTDHVDPLAFGEDVESGMGGFGKLVILLDAEFEDLALRLGAVGLEVAGFGAGERASF